jgi:hypothetical protein
MERALDSLPEGIRLRAKIQSRLERLETLSQDTRLDLVRIGLLTRLSDDFGGERQIVVVKRQATSTPNWESCGFEQPPGPEPPGAPDQVGRIYLTDDDLRLL